MTWPLEFRQQKVSDKLPRVRINRPGKVEVWLPTGSSGNSNRDRSISDHRPRQETEYHTLFPVGNPHVRFDTIAVHHDLNSVARLQNLPDHDSDGHKNQCSQK